VPVQPSNKPSTSAKLAHLRDLVVGQHLRKLLQAKDCDELMLATPSLKVLENSHKSLRWNDL
jgi:hypothetical protein